MSDEPELLVPEEIAQPLADSLQELVHIHTQPFTSYEGKVEGIVDRAVAALAGYFGLKERHYGGD